MLNIAASGAPAFPRLSIFRLIFAMLFSPSFKSYNSFESEVLPRSSLRFDGNAINKCSRGVCVSVCMRVHTCMYEGQKEKERERECVCVCVDMGMRTRVCVSVYLRV